MAKDRLIDTLYDGRYRIERRIGSGGMANVYLAEDASLGRQVAIKVLNERYAEDEQFVERFSREASSAARLNHPNIVQVYDRGEFDGTPYIAMEFVDGTTLKELITRRGALPEEEIYPFAEQALAALGSAHRHGIVHRDVKPHNMMVDAEGRLKIADFGIARAGAGKDLTEVGSIIGTAQYLSPEQARGESVSAASDLYSMGVVLYEMSTGKVPFDGDSPVNIALQHVNDPVVPPSNLRPGMDPALESVILRALSKDPEQRYRSSDEFVQDLRRARDGDDVSSATQALTSIITQPVTPPLRQPTERTRAAAEARAATTAYRERSYVEQDEPETRGMWPWLLALLLLLAVAGIAIWALSSGEDGVAAPDVVGLSQRQAERKIESAGLRVGEISRENADEPKGRVLEQDPDAEAELDRGSSIDLVVSSGPETKEVPDLTGIKLGVAQRRAKEAGFVLTSSEQESETVPKGVVISQNPPANSQLEPGGGISVQVSTGAPIVRVPSLFGLTRQEAEERLVDSGLAVGSVTEEFGDGEPGTVIGQDPAAGAELEDGSAVDLLISKGKQDTEVPDVIGMSEADATATLQQAGFTVETTEEAYNDPTLGEGVVREQQPEAEKKAKAGEKVQITVWRYDPAAPAPPEDQG